MVGDASIEVLDLNALVTSGSAENELDRAGSLA